jgi:tRNA-dihydrouridine synthase C
MEGIIDYSMREMFSAVGGIDRMVTEFVRISEQVLPEKVFRRYCPELNNGGKTLAGTEVYLQLLGDKPQLMAENAAKVAAMGAAGIDINFGCPAKTVNNSGGGSVLLQYPEKLYQITHAVRQAVPAHIPVTVKTRLGFKDNQHAIAIAQAIAAAGANELAVHGRTKVQGYKPPAFWDEIGLINSAVDIPVIANGEIWNTDDLQRCMQESDCSRIMLGRGLVACPDLALFAKDQQTQVLRWPDILHLLEHYYLTLQGRCAAKYQNNLLKQWMVYLRVHYGDAHLFFETVKTIREPALMLQAIVHEKSRYPQHSISPTIAFTQQTQKRT